jgi:hypothetical protein
MKKPCFECDKGHYHEHYEAFTGEYHDTGDKFCVPSVKVQVCDKCGDKVISAKESQKIDDYLDDR